MEKEEIGHLAFGFRTQNIYLNFLKAEFVIQFESVVVNYDA
jgi:hypothetical protein